MVKQCPLKRFHTKHTTNSKTGCWEWSNPTKDGRLVFNANKKSHLAARWVYEHLNGSVGSSQIARTCDNPVCVNPNHAKVLNSSFRFFSKVDKSLSSGCWNWLGSLDRQGYGWFTGDGLKKAHRWSYVFHSKKSITPKTTIRHTCDNPSCVNPKHLVPGSHINNMSDMTRRGRQAKGEAASRSKLTECEVREIRRIYKRGSRNNGTSALGRRYHVHDSTIGSIVNRQTWKHI